MGTRHLDRENTGDWWLDTIDIHDMGGAVFSQRRSKKYLYQKSIEGRTYLCAYLFLGIIFRTARCGGCGTFRSVLLIPHEQTLPRRLP